MSIHGRDLGHFLNDENEERLHKLMREIDDTRTVQLICEHFEAINNLKNFDE